MSNTLFALARHPEVVEKLRKEILDYGDKPLTFEGLRFMVYLRWTINESHRLYPVSLQTVRSCVKNTTLPTGGGDDGKAPIFCAKGDIVHCNWYLMHRDPDLWELMPNNFVLTDGRRYGQCGTSCHLVAALEFAQPTLWLTPSAATPSSGYYITLRLLKPGTVSLTLLSCA
ncbi:uncharacterized protein NFIA_045740 [Aspergillus fischeri NRRL 181]|uniref:Cytochrome P450 n=1 Tax=Neosartorya fischeri (strain ATCC 1020 / DSM 3700 / CBS 544.65 / FGSC A1164 / JCM 1740 / NRRL 181 / WB 181) TaxID=331117 RepID=A1CVH7_NEOFI|nr:uncharacterized protein NFIA_045740 [Aspergillus fischeri NRRL 181]EAW25754.1 hypothetical protein NFIA_045740 [Aspergillus fischeri NRRL 181]